MFGVHTRLQRESNEDWRVFFPAELVKTELRKPLRKPLRGYLESQPETRPVVAITHDGGRPETDVEIRPVNEPPWDRRRRRRGRDGEVPPHREPVHLITCVRERALARTSYGPAS